MKHRVKPTSALDAALRQRPYVHFDVPRPRAEVTKLVTTPDLVERHSFFPFLRLDMVRNKVKRLKGGGKRWGVKVREIRYAAHSDSAIYAYYCFLLAQRYEGELDRRGIADSVIAFRSLGKSNLEFAAEAFEWIQNHRPCVALGFDVRDFFGSLDHALLKDRWSEVLGVSRLPPDHFAVFRSITRHSSVELIEARRALGISRSQLQKAPRLCSAAEFRDVIRGGGLLSVNSSPFGVPQGSPISALLSNMYMLPFDQHLSQAVGDWGGIYRRYCDDILVVVPGEHVVAATALVEGALANLKLEVQKNKTLVCEFNPTPVQPLQYLGLLYDGGDVYLRSNGIAKFFTKMRAGVNLHKKARRTDGGTPLYVQRKKKLLMNYTEHAPPGMRSYVNYGKRAAEIAASDGPKRQLKGHQRKFKALLEK